MPIYLTGARKKKSPGLIFNPKPVALKINSPDFSRAANCGIELFIGGENTFSELLEVFNEVGKIFKVRLERKFKEIAKEKIDSY